MYRNDDEEAPRKQLSFTTRVPTGAEVKRLAQLLSNKEYEVSITRTEGPMLVNASNLY